MSCPRLSRWGAVGILAGASACADVEFFPTDTVAAAHAPGSTVTTAGDPATLDLVTWNVEWFGSRQGGPRDDALQVDNVAETLLLLDADLIALQEVVSGAAFDDLLARLGPGFDGLLASDEDVVGNRSYGRSEQKVALVWRTDRLALQDAEVVLRELDWAFAGRPPLLARFAVDGDNEHLRTVVTLHAKAASDLESWSRRQAGARGLLALLEGPLADESVAIAGDFNDDLERSIRRDKPSPYQELRQAYPFASWRMAVEGIATTAGGRQPIDHILLTGDWDADASAEALVVVPPLADFSRTTSDHFPVVVSLDWPAQPLPLLSAGVVINEVLANEPGSDPAGEFVELVNTSTDPVDLQGWTLSDDQAVRHVFAAPAVLPPGGAAVVFGDESSVGQLALGNSGDTVVLADPNGRTVSVVPYGRGLADRDGVSMVRLVEGDPEADFVPHDTVSDQSASPGTTAAGDPW